VAVRPWQQVLLRGVKSPWSAILILCLPGLITLYYDTRNTSLDLQQKQLELEHKKAEMETRTANFVKNTADSAGSFKDAVETLQDNQKGLSTELTLRFNLLNTRLDALTIRLDRMQFDGLSNDEAIREKARLVLGDAVDSMEIGHLRAFVSIMGGRSDAVPSFEGAVPIKAVKGVRVPDASF